MPVYIFVLAGPLVTGIAKWSDGGYWIFAAPLCLLLIGLGSRHQRNAVPMLTGAVLIPLLLWEEGNAYARALSHCNPLKDIPHADLGMMLALVIAMAVVIALAGLFGGIVALRALASSYHRKYYSDAQFQMLSWFALLTILFAIVLFQPRTKANDVLLIAIPVAVFAFVYVRSTRRLSPSRQTPPLLLLLRVFGDSSQREQLLDEVSRYWRFIGPICLIGGPDLAKANLEPHELLAFVALRTERGFITDDASLAQRLDEIDREPDPDSRYRVNEFYCTDRMWVKAVEELIHRSNAVLIDLRGFAAARAGTAIELSLLSRIGSARQDDGARRRGHGHGGGRGRNRKGVGGRARDRVSGSEGSRSAWWKSDIRAHCRSSDRAGTQPHDLRSSEPLSLAIKKRACFVSARCSTRNGGAGA